MAHDGIPVIVYSSFSHFLLFADLTQLKNLEDYQIMVQQLCAVHHPRVPTKDVRHESIDPTALETYVLFYDVKGVEYGERRGVHHLAHAWTQKGHNNSVSWTVFISSQSSYFFPVDNVKRDGPR